MKVYFLNQPFLLYAIDIYHRNKNMRPYKLLDYAGIPSICPGTVIAVGRIIKYRGWDKLYEVRA